MIATILNLKSIIKSSKQSNFFSKYDNMCTNSKLVKMVKLVTRNLTKFCQILENFTFLESFDGGQYDYNVCNHLSVKIHATLVNFLVLDFRPLHTALHKI